MVKFSKSIEAKLEGDVLVGSQIKEILKENNLIKPLDKIGNPLSGFVKIFRVTRVFKILEMK